MDSDEVLRLKQINGLQELFATVNFPAPGRLNNYSWRRRSLLPATSIPSWQNRDESVYGGGIGAKHRQRNRRYTVLPRQHWQNSTSSSEETAL